MRLAELLPRLRPRRPCVSAALLLSLDEATGGQRLPRPRLGGELAQPLGGNDCVLVLAEVQRKLEVPLNVCSGGIREGAVLASLDAFAA